MRILSGNLIGRCAALCAAFAIFSVSPAIAQDDCLSGVFGTDGDNDGWCGPPNGLDCDDNDDQVFPGALEICDSIDNNCNGAVDEDQACGPDTDSDGVPDSEDADDDNDGITDDADTDPLDPFVCMDSDSDTCDDCAIGTDNFGPLADNNPLNDGVDTDGDGLCDAGDPDADNDTFPPGPDCNDLDPNINPDALEQCNDGIDNNCDGQIDEGCAGPPPPPPSTCGDDTKIAIQAARDYQQTTRIVGRSCDGSQADAAACISAVLDQQGAYFNLIGAQDIVQQNCVL
jgi:hypothetical protein